MKDNLLISSVAKASAYHVSDFVDLTPESLLHNAFHAVLGRAPDLESYEFFSAGLLAGRFSPIEVLGYLRTSPEGRHRRVRIRGLWSRFFLARIWKKLLLAEGKRPHSTSDRSGRAREESQRTPPPALLTEDLATELGGRFAGRGPTELARVPSIRPISDGAFLQAPRTAHHDGFCIASVCTFNYLYFARTLIDSLRCHHPDVPVYLAVVDAEGRHLGLPEGVVVLSGRALAGSEFGYMALKYSAAEMCCALKAYLVDHIIRKTGFEKVVFLDADTYVFAPMTRLLDLLEEHDFVVTPHTLAPFPEPNRTWEKPTLGDLSNAGLFNAGMFGLRANEETARFIETWRRLVSGDGAFLGAGQHEQNFFNWVICFLDHVHILRDPTYNVAYWNLHDRSVRYLGLDEEDTTPSWTVDGRPLVIFHFSGFSLSNASSVSAYDRRYSIYLLPSIARLLEFYREALISCGARELMNEPYSYDRFESGIRIDRHMRSVFKHYEKGLRLELDPWTKEGEEEYCRMLLSPVAGAPSLVPILFKPMYDDRADLQAAYPDADVRPAGFLRWIATNGVHEYDYRELYDRYRPMVLKREGAIVLLDLKRTWPALFNGLEEPLRKDLRRLLDRLRRTGLNGVANQLASSDLEHFSVSKVWSVRQLVRDHISMRGRYPDLLFGDSEAFASWLTEEGVSAYFLSQDVGETFRRTAGGKALARIFSYVNCQWHLASQWPLAFVGEGSEHLARLLLSQLDVGREYDLEDVVMFLWLMEEEPWSGLGLTFELLPNLCRQPSPRREKGQEELLAPVLGRDPRFREALEQYRARYRESPRLSRSTELAPEYSSRAVSIFDLIDRVGKRSGAVASGRGMHWTEHQASSGFLARRVPDPKVEAPKLVNLFGYFKSPIGLGMMTHGLEAALELNGVSVRRNVLGNMAMQEDLRIDDFIQSFDPSGDTNIFVTYPHHHEVLLNRYPLDMVAGRRNIAYLAWEQRDGSHYWRDVYSGFDDIWALSEFAATHLSRHLQRRVVPVPCALDFATFPDPAIKTDFNLDPDKFVFLYVFDANSSIERKNPEAAVRAFKDAFQRDSEVCLLLKVSHADRLEHRTRLRRLMEVASQCEAEVRMITADLTREDILRLISTVDCYVSLHRAEGFGYTCAEAMAYGKPVIATRYSGNLQFMTPENSYLVDFEEVEVAVPDGPFQRGSVWAEADVAHAAQLMRTVYLDRAASLAVGARAQAEIRATLSPSAVSAVVARALDGPESGAALESAHPAISPGPRAERGMSTTRK